jgi:hypothetical protein
MKPTHPPSRPTPSKKFGDMPSIMLDDQLFRWNLTINLKCEKCNGTAFVEDVVSSEIFCATCGMLISVSFSDR